MFPLAVIMKNKGFPVGGSDRAFDRKSGEDKAAFLRSRGISIFPQDGSGIVDGDVILVTSSAVEESIPDVEAARVMGAKRISRAELLADLFNSAPLSIGVAGTSGKSTTVGMIGWLLSQGGFDPTIVNGATMKNFIAEDAPFASSVAGKGDVFLCEVDESDGSIAHFTPKIAVVNNVALDHKPEEELQRLFADFCEKSGCAILNADNAGTRLLAETLPLKRRLTYSLVDPKADFFATLLSREPHASVFHVKRVGGQDIDIRLPVPGLHNISNALAALAAAEAVGLPLTRAARALEGFSGIKRRLEVIGEKNGVAVIDDFAHNPDKIAASLATLHAFPGRLLILFQPHGYGPLRLMRAEFVSCFAEHLSERDILAMAEAAYFGGTADRSVKSADIAAEIAAKGKCVLYGEDRDSLARRLIEAAQKQDRIVIMGARDDSLSKLAQDVLDALSRHSLLMGPHPPAI
ncbi:UDP-N-acetylmuramate--L-alanine ligase [Alphaproteobacteria bacterium]|nr:UDP-N-acetylmuramate--L-alanine ligase [Alphaproteobacteria bacterium]